MYKIKLELTSKGITQAINEAKKLKQDIEKSIHNFLQMLVDSGVEIAKANVQNIDTGATKASIRGMYINQDKAVIIAGGNAVWLEFGTGVSKNKSSYTYNLIPLPERIVPIGTYGHGNGSNAGWWYETDDPRYIRYTAANGVSYGYTRGIKANKFMLKTIMALRNQAPKWAEQIFAGIK